MGSKDTSMTSRNAQAGPSHSPTSASQPDAEELARIQGKMTQSRKSSRRSSIFSTIGSKTAPTRRKVVSVVKRTEHEPTHEGLDEEERDEMERKKFEEEERLAAIRDLTSRPGPILYKEPEEGDSEEERGAGRNEAGLEKPRKRQEYVWDVLFENQRGIYLLGKAYFSSNSLLPADPSPFTVPSHSLPSASSFTVAQPATPNRPRVEEIPAKSAKRSTGERPIETGYTLDTYQTPSPAWVYITPWMTNMRAGTDEAGWRYNYYFRRNGWKGHAGTAGWGGWVRRREWVRLRCFQPEEEVLPEPKLPEGDVDITETLEELLEEENGVDGILKVMGKIPLDRRKMEIWERWLDEGGQSRNKLQKALQDDQAVDSITKAFTYHSTVTSIRTLLASHHIDVSSATHTTDSSSSASPGTPTSQHGYIVPPPRSPSPETSTVARRDTPSTSPKPYTDD